MMGELKKRRIAKGLTQEELARELNVTQAAVTQWELGLTKPKIPLLIKLANVLACTVDDLLQDCQEEQ